MEKHNEQQNDVLSFDELKQKLASETEQNSTVQEADTVEALLSALRDTEPKRRRAPMKAHLSPKAHPNRKLRLQRKNRQRRRRAKAFMRMYCVR